jgi:ribose 5-phosphate isomerase B
MYPETASAWGTMVATFQAGNQGQVGDEASSPRQHYTKRLEDVPRNRQFDVIGVTDRIQAIIMKVATGTDHGGFALRHTIQEALRAAGHEIIDCGAVAEMTDDDYPVFAARVAHAVAAGAADRGILLCGSGVGASIAANKVAGVRAALCHDVFSAHQGVEDDDMNVICLGARVVGPSLALDLVSAFLNARFSGAARHQRRLAMVRSLERGIDPEGRG